QQIPKGTYFLAAEGQPLVRQASPLRAARRPRSVLGQRLPTRRGDLPRDAGTLVGRLVDRIPYGPEGVPRSGPRPLPLLPQVERRQRRCVANAVRLNQVAAAVPGPTLDEQLERQVTQRPAGHDQEAFPLNPIGE